MKFICLGYLDESRWDELSEEEKRASMENCFAYDDELRRGGHFVGGEALQSATHAVTLRWKDSGVAVNDGPFTETKEHLGGILILEARDLNHAISLMTHHPGVRLGPFEIRAANEEIHSLMASRGQAAASGDRD